MRSIRHICEAKSRKNPFPILSNPLNQDSTMSELALKLIRENIEKHERGEVATFLDLGNCGMTEENGECVMSF